ncbi:MAG: hypothetical protein COV66_09235 [Nitrospinae bacterium CG11_big_fil_rev_8_21_14_0_20_45_15]|nr:MAG: hypothetical protein COV66_09235 [Nitrospinae bacterium CG11_big_fil_rev_8_21_14_0_20_45_15]
METHIIFILILGGLSILIRKPFLDFPIDDDFAVHTYIPRFAKWGLRWKKDLALIGIPIWKMKWLDRVYGQPEGGIHRTRNLQTAFHIAAVWAVYGTVWSLTGNVWAAFAGGGLYAFYGTSPDLVSGSFNHEQFYIPFMLAGGALACSGGAMAFGAGLCFGIATFGKTTVVLFSAILTPLMLYQYGWLAGVLFLAGTALPILVSQWVERRSGHMDELSRKQLGCRYATTIRSTLTKSIYFSHVPEIILLLKRTLPLWIAGLPGFILLMMAESGILFAGLLLATVGMIIGQRAFSRYHFLPSLAWLCVGSGVLIHFATSGSFNSTVFFLVFYVGIVAFNVKSLLFFYTRPCAKETLAQYEKFDQYIYVPYLARVLKRWRRLNGQDRERIYVWGTFSQFYHYADAPSSDTYLHYCIGPWDTPFLEVFYDSFIGGLLRHKPPLLVRAFHDLDPGILEEFTGLRYERVKTALCRFPVYRLTSFRSQERDPLQLPWQEKLFWMELLTQAGPHIPGIDRFDFKPERMVVAYKECRKLMRLNPEDIDGLIYFGELSHHFKKFSDAVSAFTKVMKREPKRWYLRILLSASLIELDRFDEAERLLKEEWELFADKLSPENVLEWKFQQGRVELKKNNLDDAGKLFEEVLQNKTENIGVWESCLEVFSRKKQSADMHRLLEKTAAIENRRDREWFVTKIGECLASLSDKPDYETLSALVKDHSGNCMLDYAIASALGRAGKTEEARKGFQEIVDSADSYDNIRAASLFRLGLLADGETRRDFFLRCLQIDPEHSGAQKFLSESE